MYFFSWKKTTTPVVAFAAAAAGAHGFCWAKAMHGISRSHAFTRISRRFIEYSRPGNAHGWGDSMGSSPGWLTAFHEGSCADWAVRAVAIMLRGMVITPPWIIIAG